MRNPTVHNQEPIAGYTIQERIGAGGYGEVWKAVAPGGLSKAIKFVYGQLDEDRAARELKALNRIKEVRHPFLLSLERIEVVDGQLVIVTELAESSLMDRYDQCRRSGLRGIPRDELLLYLRDAADALDYMSEQYALQHLDVKPENLLLVGGRVKVADFGLVKHLHDVTASLMGGLTPLYAPPEVFDGRPSLHSDQYSLAIVYQQMLTGTLPFAGTTAAQLARQHLHEKPRLKALPDQDRPVIARALAKSPEGRFASCREMIEQLVSPSPVADSAVDHGREQPPGAAAIAVVTPDCPTRRAAHRPQPVSVGVGRQQAARPSHHWLPPRVQPAAPAQAASPIAWREDQAALRPTIVVGLGGTGARVLARLHTRLRDRFGNPAAIAAVQTLLIDTEASTASQLAHQTDNPKLANDALIMPLRRPTDYRSRSRRLIQSISRRWLYNIPKSLRTEGMRPLGRLALVDHADQLVVRLREAIRQATCPDALAASAEAIGLPFQAGSPHVVVVASTAGGTGSGMVLDVAYALRTVLAELQLSDEDLNGLLVHWTGRNTAAGQLALGNTYACLCELAHYSRADHPYPGDPSCGFQPSPPDVPPFANTWLLHLGDRLGEQQVEAGADQLAEYLYLDVATATASLLDRSRRLAARQCSEQKGPATVRTFGLAHLGVCRESLLATAANLICRSLVRRWLGLPAEQLATSLSGGSTTTGSISTGTACTEPEDPDEVGQRLRQRAGTMGLNVQGLAEKAYQIVAEHTSDRLQRQMHEAIATIDVEAAGPFTVMLQTIDQLGGRPHDSALAPLPSAVLAALDQLQEKLADMIQQEILQLLNDSPGHLRSAQLAVEWFGQTLDRLRDQSLQLEQQLDAQLDELAQQLRGRDQAKADEERNGQSGGSARQTLAESLPELSQYLRLRLCRWSLDGVHRLLAALRGRLAEIAETMNVLAHQLSRLLDRFSPPPPERSNSMHGHASARSASPQLDEFVDVIRRDPSELAAQLQQLLGQQLLDEPHGLWRLAVRDCTLLEELPVKMRHLARRLLVSQSETVELSRLLLDRGQKPGVAVARLKQWIETASPTLNRCGGKQRLWLALPDRQAGAELARALEERLQQPVLLTRTNVPQAVLCCEIEQMPLAQVAAALVKDQRDCAHLAARLRSRSDIDWSPWS